MISEAPLSVLSVLWGAGAGAALMLALLLLWREISWAREPKWLKNAPRVPARTLTGMIGGTILATTVLALIPSAQRALAPIAQHADDAAPIHVHNDGTASPLAGTRLQAAQPLTVDIPFCMGEQLYVAAQAVRFSNVRALRFFAWRRLSAGASRRSWWCGFSNMLSVFLIS